MVAKGLLLKGGAGLATAAAGGTGIYYGVDHYLNQLTKFDQGLIDHLNVGGKIKFAVLSGGSTTELSNFPSLSSDQTIVATVKVTTTNGGDANTNGEIENKSGVADGALGTKKYLAKLNGGGDNGTDWTWTCEIKFKKNSGDPSDLADEYKNKLVSGTGGSEGFFNKLKDKDNNKDLKIKFIKNCAKARTKEKNRVINGLNSLVTDNGVITEANKIKSTKEFDLKGGGGNNSGKLVPKEQSDFDFWFSIK